MSAKLSKEITDLVRDGRFVLSAFETDGAFIASSFLEDTRRHLEDGDDEPRPDAFLVALSRRLRASLDHLVATDLKVAEAEGRESVLRAHKKEDKRQLGFLIVALRRIVLADYVDPDMDNLGLQPLNVRDSFTVLRRAGLIAERFAAGNLAQMLGQPRFDKPAPLRSYVDEVRTKARELLALVEQVNEAHRETDRARRERKAAKKDFKRVYLRASRLFEDLCRLAGHDGIAARVRKPTSRPASSKNEPEGDGDVSEAAPSEDSREDERRQESDKTTETLLQAEIRDLGEGPISATLPPHSCSPTGRPPVARVFNPVRGRRSHPESPGERAARRKRSRTTPGEPTPVRPTSSNATSEARKLGPGEKAHC